MRWGSRFRAKGSGTFAEAGKEQGWHYRQVPWVQILPAFAVSVAANVAVYVAAGPTLGLFFGTFLFSTLLLPPLQMTAGGPGSALLSIAGLCGGAGLVWSYSVTKPDVYLWDSLRCMAVLICYLVGLAALGAVLRVSGVQRVIAGAMAVIIGLAWLTWPVWLSHGLEGPGGQTLVSALVPVHPLFCVNSILKHFGAWDHYPALAYPTLTVLNQDVAYTMPKSMLPTLLLHGGVGGGVLLFAIRRITSR